MKFLKSALGLSMVLASGSLIGCMTSDEGGAPAASTEEAYLRSQGKALGNAGKGLGVEKVSVCHVPPGNSAKGHTITVGSPALEAHLAHGDVLGECGEQPPVVDPPVDSDPTIDPTEGAGEET